MEDEKIIELFNARDESAIVMLREKYGVLLYSVAKRILESDTDVEECVDDAFLALWRAIPPEKPESLRAYACRIVRNLALMRVDYNYAKKRKHGVDISLDEFGGVLPDGAARDALDRVDLKLLFNEFLSAEKPETRRIFVLRYFFYDSVKDISRDCGISESKVKSSLMRTRNRLKKFLTEKGVTL